MNTFKHISIHIGSGLALIGIVLIHVGVTAFSLCFGKPVYAAEVPTFHCADLMPPKDIAKIRGWMDSGKTNISEEHPIPTVLHCRDLDSGIEWYINPNVIAGETETFYEKQRRTASKEGAQAVQGVWQKAFVPIVNGHPDGDWLYVLSSTNRYVISIFASFTYSQELGKEIYSNLRTIEMPNPR